MNFLSPVSSRNEGSSSIHCMPHVCGPCYLCKNTANYYKHRNDLVGDNILAAIEKHTVVTAEGCICWNCIKDTKRNTSNPNWKPRWIQHTNQCLVPACTNKKESAIICRLSSSTCILDLLGLPTAEHQHSDGVPLCPAHYRFIHRTLHESDHTYKEIKCTVCSMAIKKNNIRHCPNPVIIEEHYRTHTDFTCSITTDDPICITCYKSHLMILQDKSVSRDEDLRELLDNLEGRAQQQHSDTDVIEAAKIQLAITVGHALLQQDVMLLPEAYRMFCSTSARLSTARGIPTNSNLPTKRAIQSYLLSALGHHLSYTCKQRRTGVLLYRTGGDLLITITKLLEKEKTNDVTTEKSMEEPVHSDEHIYDSMTTAIHQQIGKFIADNKEKPYDVSELNFEKEIAALDPRLWQMMCSLTRSVSEISGKSACSSHHDKLRNIRRFYCLCVMFFCTDSRCSTPMHVLLTDIVDSHGGSNELIKVLNRVGAIASLDTRDRAILPVIKKAQKSGILRPSAFTIYSFDNLDYLSSNATVYCGDQHRSWHGTSVQAVQPQPTRLVQAMGERANTPNLMEIDEPG